MTPRPQPGHPASTDLALGSSSAAAGETGRGALGMKAALATDAGRRERGGVPAPSPPAALPQA